MNRKMYQGDDVQYWLDVTFFAGTTFIVIMSIVTAIACMRI